MAQFDLNFSPSNNRNHSFDLNINPPNSDDHDSEYGVFRVEAHSVLASDEPCLETLDPIVRIISSSENTIVIDLNTNPADESSSEILELDSDQLYEDSEENIGDLGPNENEETQDPLVEDQEHNANATTGKKKNYSNGQRWAVYNALLERSVRGKVGKNTTKEVANLLSVHIRTVQRIWKRAKDTLAGQSVDVSQRRKHKCGRKKIPLDIQQILNIPLKRRTTLRTLAEALGISYSVLYRRVKEGLFRRHSNSLKPHLREGNKVARLQFCFRMVDPQSLSHEPQFVDMYNIVHIDEKWFYMTKRSENYYLLREEDDPIRTCQSKNFIGKVMVLVAMARPRFDGEGNETFSGKIGVWPFVTIQPARRRSRNREAGTMEVKPITSVKRDDVRRMLIEKVLPGIRQKWPLEDVGKVIYIQQDNARTHVDPTDIEFQAAASQNGFEIQLMCQPPNSPDLNILDLGFFSAIQALQHKVCPKNVEELIHAVKTAFEDYPARKINHIFLTLQLCMQETMRIGGSNNYKIPHMKKEALERVGMLPKQIKCSSTIVESVRNQLRDQGSHICKEVKEGVYGRYLVDGIQSLAALQANQEETSRSQQSSDGKGNALANSPCTPKAANLSKLQASAKPFILTQRQASPFPPKQLQFDYHNPQFPCTPISTIPTANTSTTTNSNTHGSSSSADGLDTVTQIPDLSSSPSQGLELVTPKPDISLLPSDGLEIVTPNRELTSPPVGVQTVTPNQELTSPPVGVQTMTINEDWSPCDDGLPTI